MLFAYLKIADIPGGPCRIWLGTIRFSNKHIHLYDDDGRACIIYSYFTLPRPPNILPLPDNPTYFPSSPTIKHTPFAG